MEGNGFRRFEEILEAARAVEKSTNGKTKHSDLLEKVISKGFDEKAMRLIQGASSWAADGILDEEELYRLTMIAAEIIARVRQSVEVGRTFVIPGHLVEERGGIVALCYSTEPCDKPLCDACERCPRGMSRFVPLVFHQGLCSIHSDATCMDQSRAAVAAGEPVRVGSFTPTII